ncbi:MAG: ABC transporter permease [Bacteroidia bacterium]|nr:ABC transporter permease [Bacteroidia bacterium]
MLLKVAWRNIWRQKVRSLVVITAIALGLWAGVFASAFVNGIMLGKVDSVIELEMSHLQIHHPEFRDELTPSLFIENSHTIVEKLRGEDSVLAVSGRVIAMPMLASPNKTGLAKVVGIVPKDEISVSIIEDKIIEGDFFESKKRNQLVISKTLAEQYKIGIRSKVVLTFQDVNSEITAAAFRVSGLYETGNGMFDELNVFVRKADISKLLQTGNNDHEIAVLLRSHEKADHFAKKYSNFYPELEVLAWADLSTGMRYMLDVMGMYLYIIVGIILLALLFSIVNTMLMAVLERVREIGMLMAVGMSKQKVFMMIMLETVFLTMAGGPLGLLLAWTSISYFGKHGIDLSVAAYGEMGFGSHIFPFLDSENYWGVTLMVIVMAILAAIYPALKALSLKPVEAIRKV